MQREVFIHRFFIGEFPNISKAVSIPNGHKTDARGDTRLAVVVYGDSTGAIVECVWADVSIEETRTFSGAKFVWLDSGWRTPGDDGAAWGPLLLRVIETRLDAISSPKDLAKKYLSIAAALDPEAETDSTESENSAALKNLDLPSRLRRMADLLEAGLSEVKSAVSEVVDSDSFKRTIFND